MKPYTYFLYHVPTGYKYYGARYSKNAHPDDFWKTYFTSSKKVKELISEYGSDTFEYKIRRVFDTAESCIIWEQTVIRRFNILSKRDWLNQYNPGSPIHRKRYEVWNKGKTGVQTNVWKGRTGRYDDDHLMNLSFKSSNEYKDPLVRKRHAEKVTGEGNPCYNKIWINKDSKHKRISLNDLQDYIDDGWSKGRILTKNEKGQFSKCK